MRGFTESDLRAKARAQRISQARPRIASASFGLRPVMAPLSSLLRGREAGFTATPRIERQTLEIRMLNLTNTPDSVHPVRRGSSQLTRRLLFIGARQRLSTCADARLPVPGRESRWRDACRVLGSSRNHGKSHRALQAYCSSGRRLRTSTLRTSPASQWRMIRNCPSKIGCRSTKWQFSEEPLKKPMKRGRVRSLATVLD